MPTPGSGPPWLPPRPPGHAVGLGVAYNEGFTTEIETRLADGSIGGIAPGCVRARRLEAGDYHVLELPQRRKPAQPACAVPPAIAVLGYQIVPPM